MTASPVFQDCRRRNSDSPAKLYRLVFIQFIQAKSDWPRLKKS